MFGANFRLSGERAYFDEETGDNPLLHMWSLSVEEQFYLVWPVLLLLIMRTQRGTRLAVPLLFAVSLAVSIALVHWMPRSAFYHLPSRGWELLTGAALALGLAPRLGSLRLAQSVSWVGLAMMALSIFLFTKETPFPGFAALLPTLGCAFVIHAATAHQTTAARLLSLKPAVFMGKISYSSIVALASDCAAVLPSDARTQGAGSGLERGSGDRAGRIFLAICRAATPQTRCAVQRPRHLLCDLEQEGLCSLWRCGASHRVWQLYSGEWRELALVARGARRRRAETLLSAGDILRQL